MKRLLNDDEKATRIKEALLNDRIDEVLDVKVNAILAYANVSFD